MACEVTNDVAADHVDAEEAYRHTPRLTARFKLLLPHSLESAARLYPHRRELERLSYTRSEKEYEH